MMRPNRGFTLVELMITIGVAGILLTLAAPSFYDLILSQRLKSITSQLVTDLQFARTEAASRSLPVQVRFARNADTSCYVIFTGAPGDCQCTNTATPICPATATEIRTVQVPSNLRVTLAANRQSDEFAFDPATGAIRVKVLDVFITPGDPFTINSTIDAGRSLQVVVKLSGRPSMCTPSTSTITGVAPC